MHCIRYSIVLLGGYLNLVASAPVDFAPLARDDKADITPILAAVSAVSGSVSSLDLAINTIAPGSLTAFNAVVQNSNAVQQSLVLATSRVQAVVGVLKIADALKLSDQVEPLVSTTQLTINDLIAKQAIIISSGAGSTTLNVLIGQKTAATNFANALQVKVPKVGQKTAAELAAGMSSAFDQGIAVFSASAPPSPVVPGVPVPPGVPALPAVPAPPTGSILPSSIAAVRKSAVILERNKTG